MPEPRGKKSLPTKFSNTDDFPADCPPTTAICGKSNDILTPEGNKQSKWQCDQYSETLSNLIERRRPEDGSRWGSNPPFPRCRLPSWPGLVPIAPDPALSDNYTDRQTIIHRMTKMVSTCEHLNARSSVLCCHSSAAISRLTRLRHSLSSIWVNTSVSLRSAVRTTAHHLFHHLFHHLLKQSGDVRTPAHCFLQCSKFFPFVQVLGLVRRKAFVFWVSLSGAVLHSTAAITRSRSGTAIARQVLSYLAYTIYH